MNPFSDAPAQAQRNFVADSTLVLGRNAILTLETDSLAIFDDGLVQRKPLNCCGLALSGSNSHAIPFFNILWAEVTDFDLTIHYAHAENKKCVRAAVINYHIDQTDKRQMTKWAEALLDRAYGVSQRRKRIKVLVNPFGGKGSAPKRYMRDIEPIFTAAKCEIGVERTQYRGHAMEIAEELDIQKWDVIACCSGDGLPYEVFNGLGKKSNASQALADVAVVQLPCGSGNAMSWNLNGTDSPSLAALCTVKGLKTPLDLVSVTQGDCRTLSFLSQAVGLIAESDVGTDHLRWMGDTRFTYGYLKRLLTKTVWPCDIAVNVEEPSKAGIKQRYKVAHDSRTSVYAPTGRGQVDDHPKCPTDGLPPLRFGTVKDPLPTKWELLPHDTIGIFYAGNMAYMAAEANFFPASLPNDGCLDLVRVDGTVPRRTAVEMLHAVSNGTFFDMPVVNYQKVSGFRVVPKQSTGLIVVDGESMPWEPFQAEVHRGLGTVLSRTGHLYEADGPKGWDKGHS